MDAVQLAGLVFSIPLAMLVIGAPVALTIAGLLWLVRMGLRAF